MKKIIAFFAALFLFSACLLPGSVWGAPNKVEKDGKTFEVNFMENLIFDGTYTYEFTFSGDSKNYHINITYPNGATYFWHQSGSSGYGGWSDDYDESRYVDGYTLCELIVPEAPKRVNPAKVLGIIFVIGVGAFYAIAPKAAWYLDTGWRFEYAKPSETALIVHRVSGIIAVAVGIMLIFV